MYKYTLELEQMNWALVRCRQCTQQNDKGSDRQENERLRDLDNNVPSRAA
jgi:hypothetical protein